MTTAGRRAALRAAALLLALPPGVAARAQQAGVSQTLHNLSISGPGEVRAQQETEVCKFCHIPHNAVLPVPLWGHALSHTGRYDVPALRRDQGRSEQPPQPDGASRLCLSCHDGTVALGEVGRKGRTLAMAGAQRLERGRRGHLGTDLSGSHPVSMVVPEAAPGSESGSDLRLRPLGQILSEGAVKLDAQGKMQCTTCHDPHSDRYYAPGRIPHFWVKSGVDEVCLACHELR